MTETAPSMMAGKASFYGDLVVFPLMNLSNFLREAPSEVKVLGCRIASLVAIWYHSGISWVSVRVETVLEGVPILVKSGTILGQTWYLSGIILG